jgi:hypothetical protein
MLDRFAPLFVLGLACAFLGWAVVIMASRIERQRRERHAVGFGDYPLAERAVRTRPNPRLWLLRSRRRYPRAHHLPLSNSLSIGFLQRILRC